MMMMMEWLFTFLFGVLVLLIFLLHRHGNAGVRRKQKSPPEPSGSWPVLGHLPLLIKHKNIPLCRTIAAMSEQHGPVFALRLGVNKVVFVNTPETAKECFTINDKALVGRPSTPFGKYIGHDNAWFGLANGAYWREVRKITMAELLSVSKLNELKKFQHSEMEQFIKELYHSSLANPSIEISEWFRRYAVNIIAMLIARKRFSCSGDEDDDATKAHEAIKNFLAVFSLFVIQDAFPCSFLEWLDPMGHIRLMKKLSKEFDEVVDGWIQDHRERALPHHRQGGQQDFIDALIRGVGKDKLKFEKYENDVIIKSTIQTLIAGSVDTTSNTLIWVFSVLLNNCEMMERAKDEVDRVVGRDKWVEESDVENLIYLNAIIKETLRLYPASPFGAPHMAVEDCRVNGYEIKKETRVMCNFWQVLRDPRVWKNPQVFDPERFLGTEMETVDVLCGTDFRYIPFGSGRRICPGNDLVMMFVPLTIARLLQGFEIATSNGNVVDMTEGAGATLCKATPLQVTVTPRLSSNFYG